MELFMLYNIEGQIIILQLNPMALFIIVSQVATNFTHKSNC